MKVCCFLLIATLVPQSKSQKPTPAVDQRGTAQSPVIVKMIPGEADSVEQNRQLRAEELTARGTVVLAFGTFALVFATVVLAVYTKRLWETTKVAADHDRKHKMQELVATHPPQIRIEGVSISRSADGSVPLGVVFELRNIGKTEATVMNCVSADSYEGGRPPSRQNHPDVMNTKILKYESLTLRHVCKTITTVQLDDPRPNINPQFEVSVFYEDAEQSPMTVYSEFRWIPYQKIFSQTQTIDR